MWIQVVRSPLGELSAYWSELGVSRLVFGRQQAGPDSSDASGLESAAGSKLRASGPKALAGALAEYFAGGELEFPLAHIDWTGTPVFHRRVLEHCAAIARGQTMTYGQLAAVAGSPAAARAVGQAMARNRWPLLIPCHRVLGHSGRLTGYSGLGGTETKRTLLAFESGQLTVSQLAANQLTANHFSAGPLPTRAAAGAATDARRSRTIRKNLQQRARIPV